MILQKLRSTIFLALLLIFTGARCCHGRLWGKWSSTSAAVKTPLPSTAGGAATPPATASTTNSSSTATPETAIPSWKQKLPPALRTRRTLHRLLVPLSSESTRVEIYLLGTSHVSNDSCADVKLLLEVVDPDVVFVELCDQRISMMAPIVPYNSTVKFWDRVKQVQESGISSRMSAISTTLLTSIQEEYATALGVELGGEFRVAYEYSRMRHQQLLLQPQQYHRRLAFILGDRPLRTTLKRAWESLGIWQKFKVTLALMWSSLQKPNPKELREWMQSILEDDTKDILSESMKELEQHFPSLARVILSERDAYLACKVYQTCRYLSPHQNHTVVAIVGAGHCNGMLSWLTNSNGRSPEDVLSEVVRTKQSSEAEVQSMIREVRQLPLHVELF